MVAADDIYRADAPVVVTYPRFFAPVEPKAE
jgi:hypothetical protein